MSEDYREWFVRIPAMGEVSTYSGIKIENRSEKSIQLKISTPRTEVYEQMREPAK